MHFHCTAKWDRGSSTVEASIIIPLIILCIAALVYMGLILYQRVQIQAAADMAAEAGAGIWSLSRADTGTGRSGAGDLSENDLYWRIADTKKDEKLERIKVFTEKALEKGKLLKPRSSGVNVELKDFIVSKRLEVSVINTYELPFGKILRIFGASGEFGIRAESDSVVDEPAELRRNIDFAVDIEKELEDRYPGLGDLRSRIRDVLSGLKGKIDELLQ